MPASPRITSEPLRPARAPSSTCPMRAHSPSRPTSPGVSIAREPCTAARSYGSGCHGGTTEPTTEIRDASNRGARDGPLALGHPGKEQQMPTKIFVNLPVEDLARSKRFYEALGYTFADQFTDEQAACLVISEDIYAMLRTKAQ